MDAHTDVRGLHLGSEGNDVARLQTMLARRVLLIFAFPLLVIVALGGYAYQLSSRVDTLDALQHTIFIERVMEKSQSHEWALREYERLAGAYPHPHVLVRVGALYDENRRPEEALKRLAHAQRIDPTYWQIYSTRAYSHGRQGEVRDAVQAGEATLRLNPYDAQTHDNLAWLYAEHAQVRDLANAQDDAAKAVTYTRGFDADALDLLIDVYLAAGDLDRAMDTTARAITRLDPAVVGAEHFHARRNTLRALQTSGRNE
jgi:tetratricopeptide (TPR) repeat protein